MKIHEPQTLVSGLVFTEGPRWWDDALYVSDMHGHRIVRCTEDGETSTVAEMTDDNPSGLGWLADGRLIVVAMESQTLRRLEPDGRLVVHADLSGVARGNLNDMIVSSKGTAYVGDMGSRIHDPDSPLLPGQTLRVTADGAVSQAADDLKSPNGHILTPDEKTLIIGESGGARLTAFDIDSSGKLQDRRVYAELAPEDGGTPAVPDGVCLDAEGGAWYADPINRCVSRVLPDVGLTDRVPFDHVPVACVLGGSDRRTLFMCVADDWRRDAVVGTTTGRIEVCRVDVAGAGRP